MKDKKLRKLLIVFILLLGALVLISFSFPYVYPVVNPPPDEVESDLLNFIEIEVGPLPLVVDGKSTHPVTIITGIKKMTLDQYRPYLVGATFGTRLKQSLEDWREKFWEKIQNMRMRGPRWVIGDPLIVEVDEGTISEVVRSDRPGYYSAQYQIGPLETHEQTHSRIIVRLLRSWVQADGRKVEVERREVKDMSFAKPPVVLQREGGLMYVGEGAASYKGSCKTNSDCKKMYNFVPWYSKDGIPVSKEEAVQLECVWDTGCMLPPEYRAVGTPCRDPFSCDTRKDFFEFTCGIEGFCVGASGSVSCSDIEGRINMDPFLGEVDTHPTSRCDRALYCDHHNSGLCKIDVGD